MRTVLLLALCSLAAAPVAAQGVVVPLRCAGGCPPGVLTADSVRVSARLDRGVATTRVDLWFRPGAVGAMDGAFFFPIPADATVTGMSVYDGRELKTYNQWNAPAESRWILQRIVRERGDRGLRGYAGPVVHVALSSLSPQGQRVQLAYTQPLRAGVGSVGYRYPLSAGTASPDQPLEIALEVRDPAGFRSVSSPSHAVEVRRGTEMGRCPPRARCGFMSVPSERAREVFFRGARGADARDFRLVYTPGDLPRTPADSIASR